MIRPPFLSVLKILSSTKQMAVVFGAFTWGLQQNFVFFLKIVPHIEKQVLGSSQQEIIIVQPRITQHLKDSYLLCHTTSAIISSTHMYMHLGSTIICSV